MSHFQVDMAEAPFMRWQKIAKEYTTEIKNLITTLRTFLTPFFHGKVLAFVDKYMGGWDNMLPEMYTEELKVREAEKCFDFA